MYFGHDAEWVTENASLAADYSKSSARHLQLLKRYKPYFGYTSPVKPRNTRLDTILRYDEEKQEWYWQYTGKKSKRLTEVYKEVLNRGIFVSDF